MVEKIIKDLYDEFLSLEAAGGIVLMCAAVFALILANSPLSVFYDLLISTPVEIRIAELEIAKPLLLWINDGLMAIFFFLVGLELKRELVEGELSDPSQIVLPAIGAIGGIVLPGLIYTWFNYDNAVAMQGWAIPVATDIAFALGILSLLGRRVPLSVKVFLTSLAIFDDLAAIVIIAVFYTANLSFSALLFALACIPLLWWLNHKGEESRTPYILLGIIIWVAMLKSGVHATLAGVIVAMFIPIRKDDGSKCMLKGIEHDLHGTVAFIILPVFAFANAGISFSGMGMEQVLHSVPMGIAAGLIFGKLMGIFLPCWLAIQFKWSRLPDEMSYMSLLGTSALCGVGFTMSLFIGSLAFEETGVNLLFDERLGIIMGSVVSGLLGYTILRFSLPESLPAKRAYPD